MNHHYSVAVHILSLLHLHPHHASSSQAIADSVGTNPVVVRQVMGHLRRAGLLETQQGKAGATLSRKPEDISLLDIYHAVDAPAMVLKMHEQPNPRCLVGSNIQATLLQVFKEAQQKLEQHLASVTLQEVAQALVQRAGQ